MPRNLSGAVADGIVLAIVLGLLAGTGAGTASAASPTDETDLESRIVPKASPGRLEARAAFLDRRLLRWPGSGGSGIFKLYYSPDAGIQALPGRKVEGAAGSLALEAIEGGLPPAQEARFRYLGPGPTLSLREADLPRLPDLLRQQLVLVREREGGIVQEATRLQLAPALDDLYAEASKVPDLGVTVGRGGTTFKLWAPTARKVAVHLYDSATSPRVAVFPMGRDSATGVWSVSRAADLSGKYYRYAVDVVVVDGIGLVRNLVTDPYSISLSADSHRSYIGNLDSPALKPAGWEESRAPDTVEAQTDMVVYELHVRDFSASDPSVPPRHRGKYAAFGEPDSNGMRHLRALARAGITDIHLLPVFDFGSVPESGCIEAWPTRGRPDGEDQQAQVARWADTDCYNWGYDPVHFGAPEGSYATDPQDGARRIVEFREMVQNLHRAGLRVGMDVVYNHTMASGQAEKSVLDRIVPGYYHRLDAAGRVERSTCCENTATEHLMMGKLMIDSVVRWVRDYKIDSFRFDLMGHQPRAVMEELSRRVDAAAGRHVPLIGEGWNFGEVANGARFVQASQLSLGMSGIGTFSDRGRDAVRGGSAFDGGENLVKQQGYINGLVYDPNARAGDRPISDLLRTADMVRLGLAGSVRTYPLETCRDQVVELQAIDYGGQPAGYAAEPAEVVNYVENHDNQTLFDICAYRLPQGTSTADRARVQMLGAAIVAFSQGVAYFHAGIDTLRSKSFDRNSYDSGDWFNRLDWTYMDNGFGAGAPPRRDNGQDYPILEPLLADPRLKPTPTDIAFARDTFRDLLRIRASSTLFRLRTAADIRQRLKFYNTGSKQVPTVIAARLDGRRYPRAGFEGVLYLINVDKVSHRITVPEERGKGWGLHPVHRDPGAADRRASEATYDGETGTFTVPPRTAVVWIE